MIEIRSLHCSYRRGVPVVHGVDLAVEQGSAVGIIGRNGAGKTCLALTLSGVLKPESGTIALAGTDITSLSAAARIRRGLSLVPEGRQIFGQLTVRENLDAAAFGAKRRLESRTVRDLYERFPVLGRKAQDSAAALSGGEQQFLAIARALAQRPTTLVLDEPTLGLSPVAIRALGDALEAIKEDGVSLILMEQNPDLLERLCHEVHVVSEGELVESFQGAQLADRAMIADSLLNQ